MKVALVIGHKTTSQGARNVATGLTEFMYNEGLAKRVVPLMRAAGHEVETVYRDVPYRDLPAKINDLQPDCVVSLHCNAFNKTASGSEVLYYKSSRNGRGLADSLRAAVVGVLGLPDRGVKPRGTEDRGGVLLRYTSAPCVILEPLFIDNDKDLERGVDKYDELAQAITDGVCKWLSR